MEAEHVARTGELLVRHGPNRLGIYSVGWNRVRSRRWKSEHVDDRCVSVARHDLVFVDARCTSPFSQS
jgi:hypothetical protein